MPVAKLRPGMIATVVGDVVTSGVRPTRRPGFRLFELVVKDASGPVRAVFPNQAFLRDVFHPGQRVVLFGRSSFAAAACSSPTRSTRSSAAKAATTSDATVHTGRIVPIYEKAGSVTPRMQRTLVAALLAELPADAARSDAGRDSRAARAAGSRAGDRRRRIFRRRAPPSRR